MNALRPETSTDEVTLPRVARLPSWLLGQVAAQVHRLVTDGFAADGARGYHYRLLSALADSGPDSQAGLGRRNGIHYSDMVTAINELADQGMVERTTDPTDRRRNVITITPAGREQLERLERRVATIQEELLAPLTPGERDQLVGLLTRILDHHTVRPPAGD